MYLFLVDFNPIKPDAGLIIWTTIIFLLFWGLIGKFAFRPIAEALKTRANDIQSALDEAKKAKEEMNNLKAENDLLLQQAREERAAMLRDAKDTKNQIISEAKDRAKSDANKIIADARQEIENQKKAALAEVKSEAGLIALNIAEQVLRKELKSDAEQQAFVNKLVSEISKN